MKTQISTRDITRAGFAACITIMSVASILALLPVTGHANQARAKSRTAAGMDSLESFVRAQIDDRHRVEVTFGKLANGTKLAPCRKIQPFLPTGARLWGRTRIGVRCVAGANWTISVPLTVKVFGEVLVVSRQIRARAALSPDDVDVTEVDLTRLSGTPLSDIMAIDGQITTRPLRAGQPLMAYHVKTRPTINSGDPVRVQVRGRGFSVMANGKALASASEGQPVRVRTDAGKIIVGVLKGRTVEISL